MRERHARARLIKRAVVRTGHKSERLPGRFRLEPDVIKVLTTLKTHIDITVLLFK